MTLQEAIVKFKGIMKAEIDRIPCQYDAEVEDDVYSDIDKVDEILQVNKVICGALEKQVPKRTTYIHLNTRYTHWGRVRHDQFRCCNCGLTKEFVDGHASQYKFCPQCGLEIDWSEEDD